MSTSTERRAPAKFGSSNRSGADPGRELFVPPAVIKAAVQHFPMLRGLVCCGAGFLRHGQAPPLNPLAALVVYCVAGGGWCELHGRLHAIRKGNVLLLPPGERIRMHPHASNPWTLYWAHFSGEFWRDYLSSMHTPSGAPVRLVGEDLNAVSLFNEVMDDLVAKDASGVFRASNVLGHLLCVLTRTPTHQEDAGAPQKIAQSIVYMSDHVHQPLRVGKLATLAGLSPAHFSVLFRQQAGCAPRAYLQLLRIHRATQLLRETTLPIKEIAARVGFADPLHFSRAFKSFQGVSPVHFRSPGRST